MKRVRVAAVALILATATLGTVITGSLSTAAQERNAENLLVTRDVGIAVLYAQNWQEHAGRSEPFR